MTSIRNIDDPPLTARSVLLSTLLGTEPPEVPVGRLVAVAALFGITENSARVALSRMARAGDVAAVDGTYRLTGRLLERQASQRASRTPALRRWDGRWTLVALVTPGADAAERASARTALVAAHLAEQREGLWLRPTNLDVIIPPAVSARSYRYVAVPDGDPRRLAAALWDLKAWAKAAERLRRRLSALRPDLDGGRSSALAPGFVLSAAVLRHLRADPLLPPELVPPAWPGDDLRTEYDDWDGTYRKVLARYLRAAAPQQ
jgi:phenylacetic acid degradation operon negative regulatory protein